VGGAAEPPPRPGRRDRSAGQGGVEQVGPAPLEPALPDQTRDAVLVDLEQPVQVAQRDVVGPGSGSRASMKPWMRASRARRRVSAGTADA